MMGRRRLVCRVSMSGFWPSETKPDNRLFSVINNLPPICRVCRVFLGVETRRGTVVLAGFGGCLLFCSFDWTCMMLATEGNLHMLAGGLRVKVRVQHPQVKSRKDRQDWPWVFRYWSDEIQPDGTVKTLRKYQSAGPSKGEGAITKKQAEIERDKFLAKLNAPTMEAAIEQVATTGVALFGEIAKMYEEGYLGRENQIAKPTRVKETFYLSEYIVPQWGKLRLNQIQ